MATIAVRSEDASFLDRVLPLAFAVLQILTPILPSLGIGEPIGARSDSVRTLITPAGWAFAIWGPLYTGSLVFAIFQALPTQRSSALIARIRWPAAGAFLGNALWALYTQSFGLSALSAAIIFFILVCLLNTFRTFATWASPFSRGERWCTVLPFSALASWLTVASIVNIAAALRFHGIEGGDATPLLAASVIIVGGVIASAALLWSQGNPPYALVFLWALSAIYSAGGQRATQVAVAVAIAGVLVVGSTFAGLWRGGSRRWFTASSESKP